jgi:hypothetical protein
MRCCWENGLPRLSEKVSFICPSVLTLLLVLEETAFGRHDHGEIVQGWVGGCGLALLFFSLTGLLIMEAIKKSV